MESQWPIPTPRKSSKKAISLAESRANPTSCPELVWWVRVAHCGWLSLCPLPTLTETPVARYLVRNPRYYLPMPFTHGGLISQPSPRSNAVAAK